MWQEIAARSGLAGAAGAAVTGAESTTSTALSTTKLTLAFGLTAVISTGLLAAWWSQPGGSRPPEAQAQLVQTRPASEMGPGPVPRPSVAAAVSSARPARFEESASEPDGESTFEDPPAIHSAGSPQPKRDSNPGNHETEGKARTKTAAPAQPEPRARPAPDTETTTAPPSPTSQAAASNLAEETRLLRAAQRGLDEGRPLEAQTRLHEHRTRYPNGALEDLRQVLEISLACAKGRHAHAAGLTRKFERAHPASPYLTQARRACQDE